MTQNLLRSLSGSFGGWITIRRPPLLAVRNMSVILPRFVQLFGALFVGAATVLVVVLYWESFVRHPVGLTITLLTIVLVLYNVKAPFSSHVLFLEHQLHSGTVLKKWIIINPVTIPYYSIERIKVVRGLFSRKLLLISHEHHVPLVVVPIPNRAGLQSAVNLLKQKVRAEVFDQSTLEFLSNSPGARDE